MFVQYSFFNNFSGQIANESWTLSFYNVLFTVLPPLVLGIFDQFVSARILDRYPQLYMLGQKNAFFTRTAFWLWIVNALYHSLVMSFLAKYWVVADFLHQILFGFSIIMFWGDLKSSDGRDSGHWFWGTSLYLAVLLTVLGKAALISEYVSAVSLLVKRTLTPFIFSLWTKYTVAGTSDTIPDYAPTHALFCSYARVVPLHNDFPPNLLPRRTSSWLFPGI